MDLNIQELSSSKAYVNQTGFAFKTPRTYLDPFIEALQGTSNLTAKAENKTSNANEDNTLNTSYSRYVVEGRVGGEIEGFDSVIGMILCMDNAEPFLKVYSGQNAHACTNLMIFGASKVHEFNILRHTNEAWTKVRELYAAKQEEIANFHRVHQELVGTYLEQDALERKIGALLMRTTSKRTSKFIGTNMIVATSKMIQSADSRYRVDAVGGCTMWNLYDALTQTVTNSPELHDKPNKTIAVAELLNII